jgi:hypothetical protein
MLKMYLEITVLVHIATSQPGDIGHGGHIAVCVGEEEQVHTAAGCHTLCAQLVVERELWCQDCLKKSQMV